MIGHLQFVGNKGNGKFIRISKFISKNIEMYHDDSFASIQNYLEQFRTVQNYLELFDRGTLPKAFRRF